MSQLHLVVGPVGAGKSTYTHGLAMQLGAVPLILDQWMARLFGADTRPEEGRMEWYMERTERCLSQIWEIADSLIQVNTPAIMEVGLIQRAARERFYERVDASEYALSVHVLDASREERRRRVLKRNQEQGATFAMEVPLEFFELASDLWEPADADEAAKRQPTFINTDSSLE